MFHPGSVIPMNMMFAGQVMSCANERDVGMQYSLICTIMYTHLNFNIFWCVVTHTCPIT